MYPFIETATSRPLCGAFKDRISAFKCNDSSDRSKWRKTRHPTSSRRGFGFPQAILNDGAARLSAYGTLHVLRFITQEKILATSYRYRLGLDESSQTESATSTAQNVLAPILVT